MRPAAHALAQPGPSARRTGLHWQTLTSTLIPSEGQRRQPGAAGAAAFAGHGRRWFVQVCAFGVGLGGPAARAQVAKAFDLDALMALLAQRKSGEARFTEERTVTGFDSPLRASGTLSFTAPDRFARQTLEPRRERMEVVGNQVRLERGGRVRQMTLDAVPELAALADGLRGTLAGNAALLRKHFDVRVAGQASLWTLTLSPRDSALAAQVRQLQLVGAGADLRTVELSMAANERSLMIIEPMPNAAAAPAAARAGATTAPAAGLPAVAPQAPQVPSAPPQPAAPAASR